MSARIGVKQLADLCRRTATAHAAGVDARKIWKRESQQGSPVHRRHLLRISQAIDRGATLAEAFGLTDDYFPPLVGEMIDVGERTGKVAEVLKRLAQHYDHVRSVRTTFLVAGAWPLFQLALAILVIGIIIGLLGPLSRQMAGVLPRGQSSDLVSSGLVGLRGMAIYFSLVGAFLVAFFLGVRGLLQGKFSAAVMTPLMQIPVLGRWLQLMALSRLAWALELTVESGMNAKHCVEIALRSTRNTYFTQHRQGITERIAGGDAMHEAFAATDAFTQDLLDAMEVGEQTGRLPESMHVLSRQYEEQAKAAMHGLAVAGGVAVLLLLALVVLAVAITFARFYTGFIDRLAAP